jgi:membrane-associated phospholipid phosphatase
MIPASSPQIPERGERHAGVALALGIATLVAIYLWLFVSGDRFFIRKTGVLPVFVLYGLLQRRRVAFLTDWLPLLTGTVLFDAVRGAIYLAEQYMFFPRFATYVIVLERLVVRTPAAPLVLQQWRTHTLDLIAVLIHGSHFAFFLLFGLVLWHSRRSHFDQFRLALLMVMGLGLIAYAVVPTVPPWMAFEQLHLLPPITHVAKFVYTSYSQELYGTFDSNPVAAMPSLHAAFPMTCALIGWQAYGRRVGIGLALYTVAVMLAVVYLGEHYVVDVIAGAAVAIAAVYLSRRRSIERWSFRQSLAISGSALALTFVLLWAYR